MRNAFCGPIQARFSGFVPCPAPVDISTLPSGYAQTVTGQGITSPVPPRSDPFVGIFTRDGQIAALVIGAGQHNQYIPAYVPTASIGRFAIGSSAIAHRKLYHGRITLTLDGHGIGSMQIGDDAIAPSRILETETPA